MLQACREGSLRFLSPGPNLFLNYCSPIFLSVASIHPSIYSLIFHPSTHSFPTHSFIHPLCLPPHPSPWKLPPRAGIVFFAVFLVPSTVPGTESASINIFEQILSLRFTSPLTLGTGCFSWDFESTCPCSLLVPPLVIRRVQHVPSLPQQGLPVSFLCGLAKHLAPDLQRQGV